jgi:hypothetical protein
MISQRGDQFFTHVNLILYRVRSNQSLKLTEPAVDDFARAKQPATIGRGLPRADWIPSLRHFVAAA